MIDSGASVRVRAWRVLVAALCASVLATACTSGDSSDDAAEDPGTTEPDATTDTASESAPTGPSPGVSDDTIKIGVTYPDTAALAAIGLTFEFGDVEAAYQAVADAINDDGGIHGRALELVFAPIDPTSPAPAEEACVRLTEDEDVFLITGFFLGDAVLCPLEQHQTAVVGGEMNADRLGRAEAPWITPDADEDFVAEVVEALAEEGGLDGRVAIYATPEDEARVDRVRPALEEAEIDVVETAIMDSPSDDPAATQATVRTIAERFKAARVDTVLIIGAGGATWLGAMADDASYRPALRFTDAAAVLAFANSESTTDLSILGDVLAAGGAPEQEVYDEPAMQECIADVEAAGIDVPSPAEVGTERSNMPYAATFLACGNLALVHAWLEAAGEVLNYGALDAALDATFDAHIPGNAEPRTWGPPPASDGDPAAFVTRWEDGAFEPLR